MISVLSRKTEIELSQRRLEQMEKYNKIISYGRRSPVWFVENIFKIQLLDYQAWAVANTFGKSKSVLLMGRNSGKSFLLAIFMMLRATLFSNSQIWIMAPTAKQSMDTFLKMENIAKRQISSVIGSTEIFYNELMVRENSSTMSPFVHDAQEYSCRLYNGSQITSLVGREISLVGKRSQMNVYDEAGKLSENFFA